MDQVHIYISPAKDGELEKENVKKRPNVAAGGGESVTFVQEKKVKAKAGGGNSTIQMQVLNKGDHVVCFTNSTQVRLIFYSFQAIYLLFDVLQSVSR